MLGIDRRVADSRQNLSREQDESCQHDQQREDVHLGQSGAPGGNRHPQSSHDYHDLDGEISSEAGSAFIFIRPERERDAQRRDEDEARTSADHRGPLVRTFLGAPLLLALHLLECGRRLGRESFELAFDFF
jgi:hypothetical protein